MRRAPALSALGCALSARVCAVSARRPWRRPAGARSRPTPRSTARACCTFSSPAEAPAATASTASSRASPYARKHACLLSERFQWPRGSDHRAQLLQLILDLLPCLLFRVFSYVANGWSRAVVSRDGLKLVRNFFPRALNRHWAREAGGVRINPYFGPGCVHDWCAGSRRQRVVCERSKVCGWPTARFSLLLRLLLLFCFFFLSFFFFFPYKKVGDGGDQARQLL